MFKRRKHWELLKLFHAQTLVKLQCGEVSDKKNHDAIPWGEIKDYGILTAVSWMKDIQGSEFNFDHRKAHQYLSCIKEAVHAGIWNSFVLHDLYALIMVTY